MNSIRKKSKTFVILAIALILTLTLPIGKAYAVKNDTPEVFVEVYVNNYDEEYIKNMEFGDGTTVGDYNYSIEYVAPTVSKSGMTAMASYQLGSYFNYAAWVYRGTELSLFLDPNTAVRTDVTMRDNAWACLSSPSVGMAGSSYWPTETQKILTFHWQYDCHWNLAVPGQVWHIEPWRSANDYATVVLRGCNP